MFYIIPFVCLFIANYFFFFFSRAHNVYVEDIMVREVVSVWRGCNYKDLRNILKLKKRLQFFPLVESLGILLLLLLKCF